MPPPRSHLRLRAPARAIALVVAALALGACAGAPAKQTATTTTVAPTTTTTAAPLAAGQQVSFYVPVVGNCFDQRTVGAAPSTSMIFLLLPCRLPHQSEVFATLDYPGATFPGTSVLEQYAKQNCVRHFAAYVGRPYETSKYDLAYDLPDQKGWDNGIHHIVGCLIASADTERLAGSVRGTKQ